MPKGTLLEKISTFSEAYPRTSVSGAYKKYSKKPALFSNQHETQRQLDGMLRTQPISATASSRVAFLTGESFCLSMLPELKLHANIVVFNDLDPLVINNIRFMIHCLRHASNTEEFEALYYDPEHNPILKKRIQINGVHMLSSCGTMLNIPCSALIVNDQLLKQLLNSQYILLGNSHFLASDERFQACRQALSELQFTYTHIDLFKPAQVQRFTNYIKDEDYQITLCNVTNLFEYDADFALRDCQEHHKKWQCRGKLFNCLEILLSAPEDTLILHGHMDPHVNYRNLTSALAIGMGDFKEQCQSHIQLVQQSTSTHTTYDRAAS